MLVCSVSDGDGGPDELTAVLSDGGDASGNELSGMKTISVALRWVTDARACHLSMSLDTSIQI